jgi:CHAT domain-containing protein
VAWRATGDPGLGERAIAEYRAALALTGPTAPERASREYNLGLSLREMVESAGEPAYLDEAVAMFRAAVRNGMVSAVEWALGAARNWGEWAASREAWPEACEAYEAGLAATEELFRAQVLRADKEAWLADAQGLPTEAAYALTRVGRVDAAVEAVETGRARLVSEVLDQGRADLSRLDGLGFGALVEVYRRSASELAELVRSGASPAVLRAARAAVDEAVEGIRAVPGYARFLARPSVADVRACVPPGTAVVYLACARAGGVALVVDDEGVRSVDLKADAAAVDKRVEALAGARGHPAWEGVLDAVGRWAWDAVVEPVASVLRARRVVVVASGRLAMVPLHAAWHPTEGGREYLVDRWVLSYAPNARAFDASRRGAGVAEDSALVVAGPEPSALAPIAHAAVEAACVARWYPNSTVLSGARADRASVLAALRGASVAHFVCHGIARTAKPLTSALVLAGDEELTLADILGLSAVSARLAVLSACDTDLPGVDLPDETVSLPTGLLQAGFAGVVATQWPVWGEPAALLTMRFHHLRHAEGQPPAEALRLAQIWLRDTTNAEKVADLAGSEVRPVARMLRLREPGDRPYRHPRVWAAFSYHGA